MPTDYMMDLFAGKKLTKEQMEEMKDDLKNIEEELKMIKDEDDSIEK